MNKAFKEEFIKHAVFFGMDDVEDALGTYIDDAREPQVRELIDRELQGPFSLRHPVLTGIPTFGIAPQIARNRATDSVIRNLARSDQEYRQTILNRKQHLENLALQKLQANDQIQMANIMADALRYKAEQEI